MNLDELIEYMIGNKWEMFPVKPNDTVLMFKRDNYCYMINRKDYSFWCILDANEGYWDFITNGKKDKE